MLFVDRFHFVGIGLLFCLNWTGAMKDDLVPRQMLSNTSELTEVAYFSGLGAGESQRKILDIQEAKLVDDNLLLGTRNALYVISRKALFNGTGNIRYDQVVWWFRQNDTICEKKTSSATTCQNFIRVVQPISADSIMLCGTNAGVSQCREYAWNGTRIDASSFQLVPSPAATLNRRMPKDDLSSLAYKYSGKNIYVATRIDFSRLDPAISRSAVMDKKLYQRRKFLGFHSTPFLRTERAFSRWLVNPRFVGMVDAGSKMLIFFSEEADEASHVSDKVVFSRVAQVCKSDLGGTTNYLNQRWTSFFKARLNCSVSGSRPFYFDEIQSVTEQVTVDGVPMVFATMTTPANTIPGSAVCAFTLRDISLAFAGSFLDHRPSSPLCWSKIKRPDYISSSKCSNSNSSKKLRFIQNHPIMAEAVPSLGNEPLFMTTQSRSRFAAIQVENDVMISTGQNVVVLYIGTNDGKLLKVVTGSVKGRRQTTFSEEWLVFRNASCTRPVVGGRQSFVDDPRDRESPDVMAVRKIILLPTSDDLLVVFRHCVMRIPKQACFRFQCESTCTSSGNPHCAWLKGACRPVSRDNVRGTKQDIFAKSRGQCSEKVAINGVPCSDGNDLGSNDSSSFVLYLVVGLVSTFSVVVLAFLLYVKCRDRTKIRGSMKGCPSSCTKEEMAAGTKVKEKTGFLRSIRRRQPQPRILVEPSSHNAIQNRSSLDLDQELLSTSSSGLKTPGSNPGNGTSIHVVHSRAQEGTYSGEDTTWSDDIVDSGTSTPLVEFPAAPIMPPAGSAARPQYNVNNNRTVGVAHPINQRPAKVSQIVRPTFVSRPSPCNKIKMGSCQRDYGSVAQSTPQSSQCDDSASQSRIVTNPNYLPVSPFVVRSVQEKQSPEDALLSPVAATFKTFSSPSGGVNVSLDSSFPPPPECVLSPQKEEEPKEIRSRPGSTSWHPSPPDHSPPRRRPLKTSVTKTPVNGFASNDKEQNRGESPSATMSTSTSGDSSSSGFVSSSVHSPQSSFKEKSSTSRKGLIVAKGLLSAQAMAPFKSSKSVKKRKKNKSKPEERYSVAENEEPIYENFDPRLQEEINSRNSDVFDFVLDSNGVPQISPEFVVSSEEDDLSPSRKPSVTSPSDAKQPKSKKSLSIFKGRRSKKGKKERMQGSRITDEDTFMSPAYDEEPFVPTVEGWQEIEYKSPVDIHHHDVASPRVTSFQSRVPETAGPRSFDDSYVEMRGGATAGSSDYAFYTMRPKGRMRSKMPKMRNTDKEWALTNKPVPVPTPAVPDVM